MGREKEETLKTVIDIAKGVAVGCYVSSFVGYILQHRDESWALLSGGLVFTALSLSLSYLYGRRS